MEWWGPNTPILHHSITPSLHGEWMGRVDHLILHVFTEAGYLRKGGRYSFPLSPFLSSTLLRFNAM